MHKTKVIFQFYKSYAHFYTKYTLFESQKSTAKGVVWENRSAGSNPAFCAKKGMSIGRPFFGAEECARKCELSRVRARKQKKKGLIKSAKGVFADDALRVAQNIAFCAFWRVDS